MDDYEPGTSPLGSQPNLTETSYWSKGFEILIGSLHYGSPVVRLVATEKSIYIYLKDGRKIVRNRIPGDEVHFASEEVRKKKILWNARR